MCLCQASDLLVAGSCKNYVQMSCGRPHRQAAFHLQRLEDISKRKDNTTSGVESQPERVWAMWGSASGDGTAAARVRLGRPTPGPPACSLSNFDAHFFSRASRPCCSSTISANDTQPPRAAAHATSADFPRRELLVRSASFRRSCPPSLQPACRRSDSTMPPTCRLRHKALVTAMGRAYIWPGRERKAWR